MHRFPRVHTETPGHSRDSKRRDPQIVFDLIRSMEGCLIAVEVFPGNTADPATVQAQVTKLQERFGIQHIACAGDRGLLNAARIEQLAAEHGPFRPSLFDESSLTTRPTPLQDKAF